MMSFEQTGLEKLSEVLAALKLCCANLGICLLLSVSQTARAHTLSALSNLVSKSCPKGLSFCSYVGKVPSALSVTICMQSEGAISKQQVTGDTATFVSECPSLLLASQVCPLQLESMLCQMRLAQTAHKHRHNEQFRFLKQQGKGETAVLL